MAKKDAAALTPAAATDTALVDIDKLIPADDDGMDIVGEAAYAEDDAGAGINSTTMVMPRLQLLQSTSKPVQDEKPGAKPGTFWASVYDRNATDEHGKARFVPVLLVDSRRRWRKLEEGGGLICESRDGVSAVEPNGRSGATPRIATNADSVLSISWDDATGTPTKQCAACVFGGGGPRAFGAQPGPRDTAGWLPKTITVEGKTYKIPDTLRRPACTSGMDLLCLMLLPKTDTEPREVVPVVFTFSNMAEPAGRQFLTQLKARSREPAFAAVWEFTASKQKNDKGTFYVPVVTRVGFAAPAMVDRARALLNDVTSAGFSSDFDEPHESTVAAAKAAADDNSDAPSDSDF